MRGQHQHHDDGFSLVEVIVAIVILGIVASSALWFFINGMQTTSNLDRQQRAVAIATSTMENTFTFDPHLSETAGASGLVIGRSATEVNAAFAQFAGVDGVADTYPLYDPHGATGADKLKIFQTVSSSDHVTYDVYTLIGSCYRSPAVTGTAQPCTKVTTYGNDSLAAAGVPLGVSRELRVIVVVTWKPIGDECAATLGICSYHVATLVDPSKDLAWNRVIKPVAVDDPDYTYDPVAGNPVYSLDVMTNDILGSVRSNPVQPDPANLLNSAAGGVTFPSDGILKYTPPPATPGNWASGIFTFKYQVFDRTGASSAATVTITLHPKAVPDPSLTAVQGTPKVLEVLTNDLGSPTAIQIVDGSKQGATISVSGTTLTYTPGLQGYDNFTYKFTDAAGQSSEPVLATVNVQALTAQAIYAELPYSTKTTDPINITSYFLAKNPGVTDFIITGGPTPSTGFLYVNGTLYTGGLPVTGQTITFQPPAGIAGDWSFPFKVTLGGRTSDNTASAVIKVIKPTPTFWAVNDPDHGTLTLTYNRSTYVDISGNDTPDWAGSNKYSVSLGTIAPNCGKWDSSQDHLSSGSARLNMAGNVTVAGTTGCWAEYTLTKKSTGETSTARITYNVSSSNSGHGG